MWKAFEDAAAEYESQYGAHPKATTSVTFFARKTVRETSRELSKVIRNLAEWSSPYEINEHLGYWFFDPPSQ